MRRESVWRMLARHARADAAVLVLTAVVVAFSTALVALLPAVQRDAANGSVRAAAAQPGSAVTVSVPLRGDVEGVRVLWPDTAQASRYMAEKIHETLPEVFDVPTTTVLSPRLDAGTIDNVDVHLRLGYFDAGGEQASVEWLQGRAPDATASALELVNNQSAEAVVEVGLSVATAHMWGVAPGDELEVEDPERTPVTIRVVGLYDQLGPGAELLPDLLEPRVISGGDARVAITALLNDESLPFARYSLSPGALDRTYTASPRIGDITAADAPGLARGVAALATTRDAFDLPDERPTLRTSFDTAVDQALAGVRDSAARMAVVLAGVLVAAVLLLVLGARELVDRRARSLSLLRSRGVGAPSVGRVFAVESVVVAGAGLLLAAGGLALAGGAVGGVAPMITSWVWMPAAVAILAPPVIAMTTTGWGGDGATAVSGLGRERRARRRAVLRVAGEVIVVALAIVGAVTLRGRGAEAAADSVTADAPVLAAPALAAVVVGLVAVRLLPLVRRVAVAMARRRPGAVGLLSAVKSGMTPLATCTLVVTTAMLAVTAWSWAQPMASGSVADPVAEPLARAELLTSAGALVALAVMSMLAVVLIGAGARRQGALGFTRVRVLGMAAGTSRQAGSVAAAWPIAVAAVVAVLGGALIAVLVLGVTVLDGGGAGAAGLAGWLSWLPALWPVVLGVLAAVVAGAPNMQEWGGSRERRSLGEQMRAF